MNKRPSARSKRVKATFATESEEAEWWFRNRNVHGKELVSAVKKGSAQLLTTEELRQRIAQSKKTAAPTVAGASPSISPLS
jgi:hypothetical protein